MYMIFSEKKVCELYSGFKSKAVKYYNKREWSLSIKYLEAAAYTAYSFYFNEKDDEIEKGIQQISECIIKRVDYEIRSNRCVFYDSHGNDKGALTQQYIRAIISTGWDMLYIVDKAKPDEKFLPIYYELKQHSEKVKILFVPKNLTGLNKIQFIYDSIVDWHADKLFMHLYPWSCSAIAAFLSLPATITKYHINHTDHTYWAGVSCVDYNFEFREYGCNVSVHNRGISQSKLLLLPYYPIESDEKFHGFPFDPDGKIIIFSGGAYYKTFDEHDTFLKICKALLDIDIRVIIVYAGFGDGNEFKNRISQNGITERFYMLGYRNDLSAIFDHSDFFLNSYPINGGLMCSYAAMHSVPILAYYSGKNVKPESIICQNGYVEISSSSIEALVNKAHTLFDNLREREEYGKSIRNCCIMPDEFNNSFIASVNTGLTQYPFSINDRFKKPELNRKSTIDLYNKNKQFQKNLVHILGSAEMFFAYPVMYTEAMLGRFNTLIKKLLR